MTELPRAHDRRPFPPAWTVSPMPDWLRGPLGAAAVALCVAACQPALEGSSQTVNAPGVPVALVGVEGAPEALQAQVDREVLTQATARRIELVSGTEHPRYRLRGYLTAYPTEDGDTALAFVWDVFDQARMRAQRVSTTTTTRGQDSDPWARIGETQITKATAQSMSQVASFLANAGPGPGAMALSEQ
jgi:hypothetical protein